MRVALRWVGVAVLVWGCGPADEDAVASDARSADAAPDAAPDGGVVLRIVGAEPGLVDPLGGSVVVLEGSGFTAAEGVTVGGVAAGFAVLGDDRLRVVSPAVGGAMAEVVVARAGAEARWAVEVWSPAELPGARVFDAASGIAAEGPSSTYEWQRLTAELAPEWRVRDGNTTTWLPATGRFWMVGGWNGLQAPAGFSTVPPDTIYPPENTTDEVWSSPDGVAWTLELPHGHGQFERRHSHNTVLWHDKLWVIGGDAHQGRDNHDVLSSADGLTWVEELPPGTPPWPPRSLQITGVFNGRLWTGGGQNLIGDPAELGSHNDLWVSDDGRAWTQVAADGPGSATRWAGCGAVDGFVEFHGAMWLVGCARYDEVNGHELVAEVWSTQDGAVWQQHAAPPWAGKIWQNVVVWRDKLWILFGYTQGDQANGWPAGNANEVWFSEDGEHWQAAAAPDTPAPGSHAQGVAVTDDFLLYAGGNYSFGFGDGPDKSVWRLVPFDGQAVRRWQARGAAGVVAEAQADEARPVWVPDAFGPAMPGVVFDGSRAVLALATPDAQPAGRTVLWVARAPYLPGPYNWEETYAPVGTVVGGMDETGSPNTSIGLSGGAVVMVNREAGLGPVGEPLWARVQAGSGLQEGPGAVHLVGMSHAVDGTVTAWIDGVATVAGTADYSTPRSWSRLGGSQDDGYYGPNSRFGGTLGAVVVLPEVIDAATAARIQAWARGRFGVQ